MHVHDVHSAERPSFRSPEEVFNLQAAGCFLEGRGKFFSSILPFFFPIVCLDKKSLPPV